MNCTKEEWDKKLNLLPSNSSLFLDNTDMSEDSWVNKDYRKSIYLSANSLQCIYEHFKVLEYYDSWLYKTGIFLKRLWYSITFKKQRILRKENKKEKHFEVIDLIYEELSNSELR